jgi:amino acid transporter
MSNSKQAALKRVVTTPMLTLYGVGNIVGAGVYVLIGKIAEPAGYFSVVAFLIAALVAFCAALSYAELASRFPMSAGVSVYLYEAFKARRLSLVVGLMLVAAGIVSSATLLKGFSGYFYELVAVPPWISASVAALILIAVMLRGIKESVGMAAILTIIEVGGLLFLIGSIFFMQPQAIAQFNEGFLATWHHVDMTIVMGVIAAAFIAFYAFVGFEDMVNIAEEVKKPKVAFPRAILISMGVVTVLYIAVTIAALGVVAPHIMGESGAPLADAYQAATNGNPIVIVIISLLATLNGVLVNLVMGSRFLYGMGKRGWLPAAFAKLSHTHVPARSVMLVGLLALVAALWLPIEQLAQLTSLLLLCVFFAVNISLVVIRRQSSPELRHLQISPTFMPWLGAIASIALLIGQGASMIA